MRSHMSRSSDEGAEAVGRAGSSLEVKHYRKPDMNANLKVTIRRARREDVGIIVAMLADDPLGGPRERVEDPPPQCYFTAFGRLTRDPNIVLVVAEDGEGTIVGCLQLCVLPGLSSQGASRGLIEDVRVASHCRSRGIGEQLVMWAMAEARGRGCKLVE